MFSARFFVFFLLSVLCFLLPSVSLAQNQALEVVVSFGQNIQEVKTKGITIDGDVPDQYSIDQQGRLHLYLSPQAKIGGEVFLRIKEASIIFQGGSSNQAVAMAVGVEKTNPLGSALLKTAEKAGETFAAGQEIVSEVRTPVVATLSSALIPLLVFNPTILANLPYLPTYFYHFVSWLLSLFGLKKRRKPWGMIYNSITKEPIALAIVRLIDSINSKVIETQVTDRLGRFGFLPPNFIGQNYKLEVVKPDFIYPSKFILGKIDGDISDIYHNEIIGLKREKAVRVNIPVDPRDTRIPSRRLLTLFIRAIKNFVSKIALGFLILGIFFSYLMVIFSPQFVHYNIFYLYLAFTALQAVFQVQAPRPWGKIFNTKTLEAVPFAAISLIETKYSRVVKTRLSDYEGKFQFLPVPGSYRLIVKKEKHRFPSQKKIHTKEYPHPYFGEELVLKPEKAVVNVDVPVDPVRSPTRRNLLSS